MKKRIHLATAFLLALAPADVHSGNPPDRCGSLRDGLFIEVVGFTSWEQVYAAFLCLQPGADDGVAAEAFSDCVGWLLAHRWSDLGALQRLVSRDQTFLPFVVRHIDLTIPGDQLEAIRANATDRCPPASASLCRSILDAEARVDGSGENSRPRG
jgi:hypothetical protein